MKRYVLFLGLLLCCILLKAQSVNYTCRYWFDQNHAQAVTTYFSESTWQAELDVGSLSNGLHTLFLQICDTSLVWEAPKSYLFYKAFDSQTNLTYHYWFDNDYTNQQSGNLGNGNLLLNVDELDEGMHMLHFMLKGEMLSASQNYLFYKVATQQETSDIVYHCWFDQNVSGLQSNMLGNGSFLLDVAELENGMHTVNVALQRNQSLCSTESYMFLKVEAIQSDTLDTSRLVYHCWFDQDFDHQQTDSLGDGHILLDVDGLTNGLHTVNVMLESSVVSVPATYMFMKVAVQDPAAEVQYHCWFDNDYSTMQTGFVGNGIFELEVGDLSNGLHTVNIQLDNGLQSTPQCYLFYKRPVGGLISKWEYWLNGEINNRHTSNLIPGVDTLSIITLLPVETRSIRSTCFHFQPNGEEPYINAKNEITLRFWDADNHFFDKMALYVDENVSETIIADTLERNTTVSIDAPRNNQIHWFKLDVGRGDYLSFKADKACTMQLFAPSGEEVYTASGPESIELRGFNVWEDGTYYLAAHDVMGSGETVSVTNNWLNRYTIVSYDVHLVGNGGCSTITFQGNGFNSLLDAYFVNWQNDTIRSLDIGHESNTTTTVSLNFYQENLGTYDAVFEFFEETIRINGALEVQEPVDIQLTSTVSYPSVFLRNTPCTYTYTITNNGNMSAYAVPVYVYISSKTKGGISHMEIDGLNLPSVIADIDIDSLSAGDRMWLQEWADKMGEDHYFLKNLAIDEQTGDSICVRSNYFFLTLAPFETKTVSFKITADEIINVWMTVPDDSCPPLVLSSERGCRGSNRSWYCCMQEQIQCTLNLICSSLSIASMVPAWAAPLAVADCICGIINEINDVYSSVFCDGNSDLSYWERFKNMKKAVSVTGTVVACIKKNNPIGKIKEILDAIDAVVNGLTLGDITHDVSDCIEKWKRVNPNCNPGSPAGGGATPVNSLDPNDIYGYLSESGSHYMRQEIQNVQYEIEFENDSTLATAAARTIIVRDTLDATKFDLNSLAARSVTIGDKRLELNGEQTFARTLDLRPEIYVIAQVEQDYDPATGIIQWTIQSLDPMTMEPTDDPNQGVLPVNYYGNGVGFIDYSINLKEAFDDGTEISNRAGIIFDQEDIIMTPTWTNTVDAVKPTSHIEEVTPVADSLSFSFVSEDNRSGVWYHSLYYRNDSTQMQWQVKKPQITENSLMLYFDDFQTTEYLVMAVDSAGNVEEKEMVAEYIYYYEGSSPASQTDDLSAGWNWWSTYIEMNGANGLELLENGLGTNGLNIKSGNGNSVEYIPDWEMWWGDEIEVRNESMYEINVAQAGTVTVAGTQAIPGAHPITLAPGWNWIGYPVNASLPTETALASLSPTEEDVIQSRNGYSMYWPDFGFWGDVEYMTPGSGYKNMSNNVQPQTLTYPSSRGKALAYKPKTVETRPEAMQHQYLMDIVAVAELEGEELKTGHYELIALSDGQPRGRASLRYCEPNGRHVAMLVVYGDASETLEFRLLDTESGRVYEGLERMDFKAEKVIGGLRKPFTMHFGIEQEDAFALEGMFPNPAKAGETVYVNMVDTSVEEGTSGIELYNALGEHIPVSCTMGSPLSFKAPQAAGVYMVRLTSRGEVYHGTLIVTQ